MAPSSKQPAKILVELCDILGRAVAEDKGLTYSHWVLPSPTFTTVTPPTQDNLGRFNVSVPSLKSTMQSLCYRGAGASRKAEIIEWPVEYDSALLAAQRWSRGDAPLPVLPDSAIDLMRQIGSPEIQAAFAGQLKGFLPPGQSAAPSIDQGPRMRL